MKKKTTPILRILILLTLSLICSGCFSARDEYAFMASQYIRSGNQLPYVKAVKSMDAMNDYDSYACAPCSTRVELPSEQGSILVTTPRSSY